MNKRQIKNNRHKEKKNDDNSKAADKLYIPRKNVQMETEENLKKYVESSNERLLIAVEGERILGGGKTERKVPEKRKTSWKRHYIHSLWGKLLTWGANKRGTDYS